MKRSVMGFLLCFALVAPGLAEMTPRKVDVGSVRMSDQKFMIVLDESSVDRAYAEWTRPLFGAPAVAVSKESFRSVVRETVGRKLAAMFPNGAPPDAALKIRIEIRTSPGRASEIGVSFDC